MSANAQVAEILYELGELYTIKEDKFRSRAFLLAAQRVTSLTEDVRRIRERGELEKIPGVGKAITAIIEEVLDTGTSVQLEEMREGLPHGVRELMQLEGVGPKTAMRLNRELGIGSVEELEKAIKENKLKELKGFGEKKEENILKSVEDLRSHQESFLLGGVLPIIQEIIDHMAGSKSVLNVEIAGSARRWKEVVRDLDVLASSNDPNATIDRFTKMPWVRRVLSKGSTRSTVILENRLQADIRVVPPESWGAALQYLTGSKDHNVKLRTIAVKKGYKLSEYGLYQRKTGKQIAGEDEAEIYRILGMSWMEPELRENRGEIEAAMKDQLPSLVTLKEINGDLHVHTKWSDGSRSIKEMAEKGMQLGLKYIAICDHSKSLGIARGLDEKRMREQMDEIDELNEKLDGLTILKGTECDIKADGSLDLPGSVLKDLDYVVGSVHSGFKSSESQMTERVITALHNDYISTLGHPTGRLIQRRQAYALNLEKVFEAAAAQRVMMEIDSFPDRLDLNDVNCRAAKDKGVTMAMGTDSHAPNQIEFLLLGVGVARRGWLEKGDVINTLSAKDLLRKLRRD